jgi:hypothetical protein
MIPVADGPVKPEPRRRKEPSYSENNRPRIRTFPSVVLADCFRSKLTNAINEQAFDVATGFVCGPAAARVLSRPYRA